MRTTRSHMNIMAVHHVHHHMASGPMWFQPLGGNLDCMYVACGPDVGEQLLEQVLQNTAVGGYPGGWGELTPRS